MEATPPGGEKIAIGGGKREEKCNCTIFYPCYPTFMALTAEGAMPLKSLCSSLLPETSISCGSAINRLKEDMEG